MRRIRAVRLAELHVQHSHDDIVVEKMVDVPARDLWQSVCFIRAGALPGGAKILPCRMWGTMGPTPPRRAQNPANPANTR